jgi:adenine-specific DNA-methyltransferase
MIALSPHRVEQEELKGKTGIPGSCFMSPFCKKDQVEGAFRTLFGKLKTKWIFVSYNSESLLKKEAMLKLMGEFGEASVIEREYKRFKAYEYNQDIKIQEYLFALRIRR